MLNDLLVEFDNNPDSSYVSLVTNMTESSTLSAGVRSMLAKLLINADTRTLIPPVVHRLRRCDSNDFNVLSHFVGALSADSSSKTQDDAFRSDLLNYDSDGISYERDQFWNQAATVPREASLLLLSGKLDPQTPYKYAENLFNALDSSRKELIAFDYAPHGVVFSTPIVKVMARLYVVVWSCSYHTLKNNGDLERLDRSCIDLVPAFNLTIPIEFMLERDTVQAIFDYT
ncbi:unnamed protein product [Phytophthora lilii]|uniref:Unnamed protein product n=1 Tax=Phytophthora lilii TaxID=2077276 RepID=A0A9W6TRV7_9STRA|nr:unnamed protein product [Phytophthora lilii]